MDLESSSSSQSSLSTKDEFENLEVDANALWELLYDVVVPGNEEPESGGEAMEIIGPMLDSVDNIYESFSNNDDNNNSQDIDWFRILEETSANDMGEWYGRPGLDQEIDEILEMGNYSFSYTEIMSDEIGYIGLWQDN